MRDATGCSVGDNGQMICGLWPRAVMPDTIVGYPERTDGSRAIPMAMCFLGIHRSVPDNQFMVACSPANGGRLEA